MELQLYLDKAHSDQAATREQLDGMEMEHKELVNEYIALKTSHVQLTSDYQKEVRKAKKWILARTLAAIHQGVLSCFGSASTMFKSTASKII